MKAIELLEKLKEKPVFKIQDVERVAYCNRRCAKLILSRLKKRKLIKQVTKNVYTTKDNIFVIASNVTYPSYISFWSASYFLGYTEQIINTFQVATTRRINQIKFENYNIKFIKLNDFFGYKKIRTDEGDIFISENEKLLIDAFLKPKEFGNLDEIEKVFENTIVSKEKVVNYLKKVKRQSVTKRVGFLLEKIKGYDISKLFKLDKNYILLNPFSKQWKKINSKWRIKI